jgi:hypothetical protein
MQVCIAEWLERQCPVGFHDSEEVAR